MADRIKGGTTDKERSPEEILMQSKYDSNRPMSPVEASDEIISLFCELHGGMEAAMPMVAYQFKKAKVDFANPTKEGLQRVADGLVKVTEFLKGKSVADLEGKRFKHLIKRINA
jgi:hypothetical protein